MENKIYMIKSYAWETLGYDDMIFDSRKKAKDFLNRFKTRQDLEIVEISLNPTYLSDKKQDPYYVFFWGSSNVPSDITLCRSSTEIENALLGKCEFEGINRNIKGIGMSIYVFAYDEDEALTKALEIRDKAIADMSSKLKNLKSKIEKSKK